MNVTEWFHLNQRSTFFFRKVSSVKRRKVILPKHSKAEGTRYTTIFSAQRLLGIVVFTLQQLIPISKARMPSPNEIRANHRIITYCLPKKRVLSTSFLPPLCHEVPLMHQQGTPAGCDGATLLPACLQPCTQGAWQNPCGAGNMQCPSACGTASYQQMSFLEYLKNKKGF